MSQLCLLTHPITLQPKVIFQELCRNKLEWGEVINDRNNIDKWTKFLHDLGQLNMFFVVRVEMSNCTSLATVQGKHMGPVCLFGSIVSMVVQSGCGQVNIGLHQ